METESTLIPVEVRGWYDGISHYIDKNGNKFSKIAKLPMKENELCKGGKIYTIEPMGNFIFKILSERDDK